MRITQHILQLVQETATKVAIAIVKIDCKANMGYMRRWGPQVSNQVQAMCGELLDIYTDSYIAWDCKQELYKIKWMVDEALNKSSTYSGEEQWLKEQEQEKIIRILKK